MQSLDRGGLVVGVALCAQPKACSPESADSSTLCPRPFLVQGCIDDHTLAVTADTAKEAFAKAIEWHVVEKFSSVSIHDGVRIYSIDEFASVMSLQEIAKTVNAAAEQKAE
jgi:hypothetical protein